MTKIYSNSKREYERINQLPTNLYFFQLFTEVKLTNDTNNN